MHLIHYFAAHQVYSKTEKGRNELVRPRFGLDSRQRRVLNEVDGVRNLKMLTELFPKQELEDILSVFVNQDFIVYLREDSRNAQSISEEYKYNRNRDPSHILTQDPVRFLKAKDLMLEVAAVHLGILGRELIKKIEQAESPHSLLMLAGRWNVALCESKTANHYAPLYLEKLKMILFS